MAPDRIRNQVADALREDLTGPTQDGDITGQLLNAGQSARGHILSREAGTVAGIAWAQEAFDAVAENGSGPVSLQWHYQDGQQISKDTTLCSIKGSARTIVTAERTALNFLATLSGIATRTRQYANRLKDTSTRVLDTRKTLPGLRYASKYAVACGGGCNHRMGLFDAFLIKENHIAAAGGIALAVARARQIGPGLLCEVEVENLEQLQQALKAGADRIMLDNFSLQDTRAAVQKVDGKVELEASGNVTLDNIAEIAQCGVDFISVGALTKHVRALDLSLRLD